MKAVLATLAAVVAFAPPAQAADIAVLDRSKDLGYKEIRHVTAAVNAQMKQIAPVWGVSHRAIYRAQRPINWWVIYVMDDSTVGVNTLGYHDAMPSGVPRAYIFARTSALSNFAWSTVLSHEALEMAVNPTLENRFYDPILEATVDRELADAVQADEYWIGDVKVSDWVFPSWFDRTASCPCDYLNLTTSPFQVRPGGYMPIFESHEHTYHHR